MPEIDLKGHADGIRADLSKTLADQGVRYVFGFYVDVHGVPKSKCVPVRP